MFIIYNPPNDMEKKQGEITNPINKDMTKEEILGMPHFASDFGNATIVVKWRTALEAMQEYATQEKQGWVKTSDRLPENDPKAEYVVMGRYDVKEFAIFHDGVFEFYDSESGSYYKFDAIWWLRLPQKPEV